MLVVGESGVVGPAGALGDAGRACRDNTSGRGSGFFPFFCESRSDEERWREDERTGIATGRSEPLINGVVPSISPSFRVERIMRTRCECERTLVVEGTWCEDDMDS